VYFILWFGTARSKIGTLFGEPYTRKVTPSIRKKIRYWAGSSPSILSRIAAKLKRTIRLHMDTIWWFNSDTHPTSHFHANSLETPDMLGPAGVGAD